MVLIHHTGKDATEGLRGYSSIFAAMDAAVEVSRDSDRREWKVIGRCNAHRNRTGRAEIAPN